MSDGIFDLHRWLDRHPEADSGQIKSIITTDCKSLYDVLEAGHGVPACKRTALEVLALREDRRLYQHMIRWVPTEQMLADPLTKIFTKESHLYTALRQGTYAIMREVHGLSQKLAERILKNQFKVKRKRNDTDQIFCIYDYESFGSCEKLWYWGGCRFHP